MTSDAPDEGDESVRRGRLALLEKAFALKLTTDEAARCTSPEATAAVLGERLRAVPGGPTLRRAALASVREALHVAARADREAIDEASPLAPHFPRLGRTRRWRKLEKELRCRLPILDWKWSHAAALAAVAAVHVAFLAAYPRQWIVEESTMAQLVAFAVLGVACVGGIDVTVGLPPRMETAERLVTWIVAQTPARYRGGTEWTTGQIAEVVDAGRRLRFVRLGCGTVSGAQLFAVLSVLAVFLTTVTLIVFGLGSRVVVGGLPAGMR